MITFVKLWWKRSRSEFELTVSRVFKLFLIFLKLNPNLTYFPCWWRIWTLIWKINGESSRIYILGFRFKLFSNLFEVSTSIHRLFSTTNLRWRFRTKTRGFYEFTWISMEVWTDNSPEGFVMALDSSGKLFGTSESENKPVNLLLFSRRFKILLRSLFFSLWIFFLWSLYAWIARRGKNTLLNEVSVEAEVHIR